MSMRKRVKSSQGIYHVMLRGVNKQIIFDSKEDYCHFLEILSTCKEISGFSLYAYCLMSNHVHLLVRESDEQLSKFVKRIGIRYAQYYNNKYARCGHLFGDRFKSEAVDDEAYFLDALRYILQNPVKAGLVDSVEEYAYSSAAEYFSGKGTLSDTMLARELRSDILGFICKKTDKEFLEMDEGVKVSDADVRIMLKEHFQIENSAQFQRLSRAEQDSVLICCKEKGATTASLTRLTGVSRGRVRYLEKMKRNHYS